MKMLKKLFAETIFLYIQHAIVILVMCCKSFICLKPGPPPICMCGVSNSLGGRVIGGETANKNEFPWQVGLTSRRGKPFCGGTLISEHYVVTAAHCVDERTPWSVYILLGGLDWSEDMKTGDKHFPSQEIFIHPNYTNIGYFNDIAIVKIQGIKFEESQRPPCFPRPTTVFDRKRAVVAGWGRTIEGGKGSYILQKVELPIVSLHHCQAAYGKHVIASTMLCATYKQGGKDACEGDSGGPLMWLNDGRWYLIGIVSWGYGCGRPNYPGVYTRFDKYYSWVDSVTIGSKFCTN